MMDEYGVPLCGQGCINDDPDYYGPYVPCCDCSFGALVAERLSPIGHGGTPGPLGCQSRSDDLPLLVL